MAIKGATLHGEGVSGLTHPKEHHCASYLQADPVPTYHGSHLGKGWVGRKVACQEVRCQ